MENKKINGNVDLLKEISLLLRSRYSLICLQTNEEDRAESLLRHVADRLNLPLFAWDAHKGLQRSDLGETIYNTRDAKGAFSQIEGSGFPAIYHFQGLGGLLSDTTVATRLVQVTRMFSRIGGGLVMTGADLAVPEPAKPHSAKLMMPVPERQDYMNLFYMYVSMDSEVEINT